MPIRRRRDGKRAHAVSRRAGPSSSSCIGIGHTHAGRAWVGDDAGREADPFGEPAQENPSSLRRSSSFSARRSSSRKSAKPGCRLTPLRAEKSRVKGARGPALEPSPCAFILTLRFTTMKPARQPSSRTGIISTGCCRSQSIMIHRVAPGHLQSGHQRILVTEISGQPHPPDLWDRPPPRRILRTTWHRGCRHPPGISSLAGSLFCSTSDRRP